MSGVVHVRCGSAKDERGYLARVMVRLPGQEPLVYDSDERYATEGEAWKRAQELRPQVLAIVERSGKAVGANVREEIER